MFVFVDSTEFLKDPYAARMSWDRLRDWRDCDCARIVVPKIVMDEAATQYRSSLKSAGRNLNRYLHRMAKLLPEVEWSLPPIPTDGAEERYRDSLGKRLASLQVEQPDHNGITLTAFPGRSTKASIVSQMILDRLSGTNQTAVLITGSSRDFGTPKEPATAFSADLQSRGIGNDQIQIYRSLFDFVKAHVKPRLRKRDELAKAIDAGTHPFDSDCVFAEHYDDIFESLSDFIEPWGEFPGHFNTPDFGSPQLAELSTVPEHFQIETLDMDGDQFVLFARYWVDGIVSCKYKHPGLDGNRTGRVSFEIQASILLDMETGEADNFEISEDFAYTLWPEDWQDDCRSDETECA